MYANRQRKRDVVDPWLVLSMGVLLYVTGLTLVILVAAGVLAGKDGAPGANGTCPECPQAVNCTFCANATVESCIPCVNGTDGRDGVDGTNGRDGINGTDGRDGVDGLPGSCIPCVNGTNGRDGINGTNGAPGQQGPEGPQGPPGESSSRPEAFSIALRRPYSFGAPENYETLIDWTDTVDTDLFPDVAVQSLFQELTSGRLDLENGQFRVGTPGIYLSVLPQYALSSDGFVTCTVVIEKDTLGTWQTDAAAYPGMLKLDEEDLLTVQCRTTSFPDTIQVDGSDRRNSPLVQYNVVWKMAKIA